MPYCPKCGKEVLEDTTYCPHCGSHIHALAPVLKLREKKLPFKVKGSPFKAIFLKEILPILILVVVAAVFITHPQWFSVPFLTTDTAANHLNQGVALYEAGEYEKAVAEYTKAIELDPKLASAYYNRGLAYFKMRQYDSALADFNKAIELDPRSSTAWVGRGIALEGLGKYKEALEAYNKSLEINPNDQRAKSNKDRLLAYLASLPITYNRGQFGLKTTTTQTLGSFKIERTATCTTYGYPFDLKLYRGVLGGQAIYIGSAETTLHYEGDWSVAVIGSEEGQKTEVLTPSGHISGNVKVAIMGVWKDGRLGLMISPAAELPAEGLTISVKVRTSWFDQEGKLIFTHTGDLPLIQHPFYDIAWSFIDASFDSSPYLTEGKLPRIPTNIEEISKMDMDEFLSLSGYKWTKIRFSFPSLETYFSGASAFLNPPKYPGSKSEYINGYAQFESAVIPDP